MSTEVLESTTFMQEESKTNDNLNDIEAPFLNLRPSQVFSYYLELLKYLGF